jgi:hypothetical protein
MKYIYIYIYIFVSNSGSKRDLRYLRRLGQFTNSRSSRVTRKKSTHHTEKTLNKTKLVTLFIGPYLQGEKWSCA